MNVSDNSSIHNCTSCGVCASVCAKKAITMQLDDNGFYRPSIDAIKCNDCELCTSVCYKYDKDIHMTSHEDLNDKPLYAAWSNDDELVKNTTSGGIADILAQQLLCEGYKVVGVVYNEKKTIAEHRIAENKDELKLFRGSKYIQSYTFDAFKEIVANCRKEKFAVFGTPCQIYALNRLATKRGVRDNFFFVDLYCHGCPSLHAWTKYQEDIKRKIGLSSFDKVEFRSKVYGWGSYYIARMSVNGRVVYTSKRANDMFFELFFSDQILNEACHDCKVRSTLEYTDVRLGDFWGRKFINNNRGVSAVSLSSKMAIELFEKLTDITKISSDYTDLHPFQSWNKTYTPDSICRLKVLNCLNDKNTSIYDVITVLRSNQGVMASVKRNIKKTLALFPVGLTNSIKRIVYSLR